ncbi:MAG: hypothetical protein HUJ22_02200 [Gracilimonas sp.]|uniref:hypothetical protein n=1 Tax=Gracilimonas sp. TaxID=1974203 RepID=UPI0019B39475|nr:hypothetical protein [Gracilimonas sp.]MBD3615356.1 hypothetical protein [Gracilimonas sp.]
MVKIKSYVNRKNSEGESFNALVLEGDLETVTSETGNVYFTARTTTVPSNFDAEKCESLIGRELPGKIVRIPCEPYDYTIPESGEVVILSHTYEYDPSSTETMEEAVFTRDEELVA